MAKAKRKPSTRGRNKKSQDRAEAAKTICICRVAGWGAAVVVILLIAVLVSEPQGLWRLFAKSEPPQIQYSWAQLVSDKGKTKVLLRAIVSENSGCHGLARFADSNASIDFTKRMSAEIGRFPVDVCEASLDLDDHGVRLSNGTVLDWRSIAKNTPSRISIIGDTGCRDGDGQNCEPPAGWALPRVAAAAAYLDQGAPDLVIHVGDFRYRGADDWNNWRKDVFEPMRPLLQAAPLIFVRGNHDNCFRDKGVGWKFFLAPPGAAPCQKNQPEADVEPTYAVELGKLRIVVPDTADSYYRYESWGAAFENSETAKLEKLMKLPEDGELWLLSHYPLFDYKFDRVEVCHKSEPDNGSAGELHRLISSSLVGKNISAILAGDHHNYEAWHIRHASPKEWRTMQFVAGNGGASLDDEMFCDMGKIDNGKWCNKDQSVCTFEGWPIEGRNYTSEFVTDARFKKSFGFVSATRKPSAKTWDFELVAANKDDQIGEVRCEVPVKTKADCVLSPRNN